MTAASKACPVCGKPSDAQVAPFCSKRCADIDLGRWLKGRYVIPGNEGAPPESREEAGDEDSA
ncbi:MAG: DNA gyrase inhibitor YacG [Rhizomicrobium sp.]